MGKIISKSKIVPISRFNTTSTRSPDFISGTYDSDIVVVNKGAKGKKSAKPQSWLIKQQKHNQAFTADQWFNYAIKSRCEVFSAWQYEAFVGDGRTQPKYYLVQTEGNIDSIATKLVPGYTSFNELINQRNGAERTVLLQPKNQKLFAEMLVNYLWLAASDFKLDHIGIDSDGTLVCLDFGESLIPFQYQESVYTSRGWCFSISSQDVLSAPFFTTYKSSNYFIDRACTTFPGIFDFLQDNAALKEQLCAAILKRCIFPNLISFAAIELFNDFEECALELQEFMTKRTEALWLAATQNSIFLEFMSNHGEKIYEEIRAELLGGLLANSRYFRHTKKEYSTHCLEELQFNFKKLATDVKLTRLEHTQGESVKIVRLLRQFCDTQCLRLKKISETTFFNKGSTDKTMLFKRLIDKIDGTSFSELAPTALVDYINLLIKEAAIIAHHRRYSKINTLFGHTDSTSWQDFKVFFRSYAGDYALTIQAVLANKSSRAIATNREAMISGYNEYRYCMKQQV